jgi:hypothetical protein
MTEKPLARVEPERFYVLRFCFGGARDILVWLMSDVRHFPPPWSVEGRPLIGEDCELLQ